MRSFYIIAAAITITASSCSSHTYQPTRKVQTSSQEAKDSIEYYETGFDVQQKDYFNELKGSWTLNSMQRQAKMEAEEIKSATLSFHENMQFEATFSCGKIHGTYTLKGTSIKFSELHQHFDNCENKEQLDALSTLLSGTVSAYTVTDKSLWLRDGSTNIVFKASR